MNTLLYDKDGRLRSGLRALLFVVAYFFLSGLLIAVYQMFVGEAQQGRAAGLVHLAVTFAIATGIAVLLGWAFGRWFDGVPLDALGISVRWSALKHFMLGAVVGGISFLLAVVAAMITGSLSFGLNRDSQVSSIAANALVTLAVFAVGAASEETFLRGYLLQTFVRSRLVPVGILVTAILFAAFHGLNPSITSLALFNTFLAGIWFGAAYLKTRDLWFPFGIHLSWNWLQGPIFGINVSGMGEFSPDPLLRATDAGPAWLTGGAYGIEGGIACTFALALSLAIIYYLPVQRGFAADQTGESNQKTP